MPFGNEPRQPTSTGSEDTDVTLRVSAIGAHATAPTPPRRRLSARIWTLTATALLVVATLVGLFVHATADPRGALSTLLQFPTPTPAPTIALGSNVVYFANAVPWGKLTIDRTSLSADYLTAHEFTGVTLPHGVHHLVYTARDFPTVRCDFSVPASTHDTCPLDTTTGANARGLAIGQARTLDLRATIDQLSPAERDALLTQINADLRAAQLTAAIAPGDRYLDAQGNIATANQPLTLALTLTTHPSLMNDYVPPDCHELCADLTEVIPGLGADHGWHIQVILYASWSLTDASGQSAGAIDYQRVALAPAPSGPPLANNIPTPISAQLLPSGWQINGLDGLTAAEGKTAEESAIDTAVNGVNTGPYALQGKIIGVGANPLEGSFVDLTLPPQQPNSAIVVSLVWRFGVVFVVDDAGQPIYAQLPHATAAEAAVMTTLVQQGVPQTSY